MKVKLGEATATYRRKRLVTEISYEHPAQLYLAYYVLAWQYSKYVKTCFLRYTDVIIFPERSESFDMLPCFNKKRILTSYEF